jgi:hypothetical protein
LRHSSRKLRLKLSMQEIGLLRLKVTAVYAEFPLF